MHLRSSFIAATVIACAAVVLPGPTASAAPVRYEAETAPATCSGTIDTDHAGYSGTGFCNGSNAVGAAAQFTVDATAAGTATVGIRFAAGTTTARPADVVVNGSRAAGTTFEGTGAWSTWATKTVAVQVRAGSNTIALSPTSAAGLPNVDYLEVEVTAGGSAGTGRLDDPNLQYFGRWNRSNASFYTMGWAGGYVDARFTGTSIGVRQRNAADLFYSIDGGPTTLAPQRLRQRHPRDRPGERRAQRSDRLSRARRFVQRRPRVRRSHPCLGWADRAGRPAAEPRRVHR